jgi:hypothetical protein
VSTYNFTTLLQKKYRENIFFLLFVIIVIMAKISKVFLFVAITQTVFFFIGQNVSNTYNYTIIHTFFNWVFYFFFGWYNMEGFKADFQNPADY